jgi:hypothetical protein
MILHALPRILRALVLGAILAGAPLLHAEDATDRLVRLVGPDAGLCLEVPRLDETLTAFEQGELFRRLEHSKIYTEWKASQQNRGFSNLAAMMGILTSKPARHFVREVLGTAVVVAAYTEPGPKMSAILLSEATSRESLDAAIKAWIQAEPCRIETVQFAGHSYYKRVSVANSEHAGLALFYATLDRTLLLSDREDMLRRTLKQSDPATRHSSLLDLPAYQDARRSVTRTCAARAYINPRAFDEILGIDPEPASSPTPATGTASGKPAPASKLANTKAKPKKPAITRIVEASWRRFEWLAVGVELNRGMVLEGVAHYSSAGLSKDAQRFIQSVSGPPEILRRVPSDAFVVLACRQPFGNIFRVNLKNLAKQWLTTDFDSIRHASRGLLLGLDPFDNVLPLFRGNFGGYLAPRAAAKPDELPFEGLLAGEFREIQPAAAGAPNAARPQPTLREALDNALNAGLNMGAAYFNRHSTAAPAIVHTAAVQGARIRWINDLGPYQPAYGLTSRYLVLATGPEAVRNFVSLEAPLAPASAGQSDVNEPGKSGAQRIPAAMEELSKRYFPTENQVLFIDTAAIRRFLGVHGAQLVEHAVRTGTVSSAQAERTLAKTLDYAGLFDNVFAAIRLGDGTARVVIGGVVNGPTSSESAAIH